MRKLIMALTIVFATCLAYAQFDYVSLDAPGADRTRALGINNQGQIVGSFRTAPPQHAYILQNGVFTLLEDASGILTTHLSEARSINDRGQIVGIYRDDVGLHGFLLYKRKLTTLDVDLPNAAAGFTEAVHINQRGDVVGFYMDNVTAALHGYLWRDGRFTPVDLPGAWDTACFGINEQGEIVGGWDTVPDALLEHGFVLSRGEFSTLDAFGYAPTQVNGINDHGQIVGTYLDGNNTFHGFFAEGPTFSTVDFPGASLTIPWDISNTGVIVGDYCLEGSTANCGRGEPGTRHGFVAAPARTSELTE